MRHKCRQNDKMGAKKNEKRVNKKVVKIKKCRLKKQKKVKKSNTRLDKVYLAFYHLHDS